MEMPEWYFRDNGFSTLETMEVFHQPVVTLAREKLIRSEGNVIDLGSGNGALLEKICQGNELFVPFGIDCNPVVISHARERFSKYPQNFQEANIFDPNIWSSIPNRYQLAILMIGRLLEVNTAQAQALISKLAESCTNTLVYIYPGFSDQSLDEIAHQFGLNVQIEKNQTVGLLPKT